MRRRMDIEATPAGCGFLAGGGEMGALMRAHDWAATPVGPPAAWPQALKTAVRLMLTTHHPMFLWWGEALTCFYNDAYSGLIGPDRHPSILGRPGREVWAEIWDIIGPQIEFVMAGQGATWHERQLIPITRGDTREDVWWTYGYSPVDDDTRPTGVGGVLVITIDASAEARAGQARAGEAERLRQLFEQAPSFMALLRGPEHVFELTNAAYLSLVGRDVLGMPVRQAFPEIEGQGYFELLDRVYATGEAYTARHMPITFASGPGGVLEHSFVDFVYQPIRDAAGVVTGIFVEGSDVTEVTRAEDALRATEARQALLLHLIQGQRETSDPDAMMLAASEALGCHLGANRVGFLDMLDDETLSFTVGWTDGSLDLLTGTFPAEGIGSAYLASVRQGTVLGIADVQQDPLTAGSVFAEIGARAIIGVPVIRNGRWHAGMYVNHAAVRHWTEQEVALVRDVADQTWDAVERARAEAALRELNETLEARVAARTAERNRLWSMTNLLVAVAAFDSTIREVNPAWPALLGWSEAELVGRSYAEFVYPDDIERSLAWAAKLAGGEEVVDLENRYRCKDGSYRWIAWAITADDSVFHCIGRDVTDQKQQADALAAAEAALRQAQKMEAVGQLTGGIAHDFNNMLQAIGGSLEMMRRRMEQGRAEEAARFVESASKTVERAASLTHRLLAFSRRQALQSKPVELNSLMHSMTELIRRTVGPEIEVELRLGDGADGPWPVLCDPNQLENVLLNLAINARDAMPEGGRLTIATAHARLGRADLVGQEGASPGDYVEIAVGDTGTGMDEATRARAFEPFFTTKPLGQGTGLGLSQLYGFVRQSDGVVHLDSAPGRGTTVRLLLPRHAPGREHGPHLALGGPPTDAGACGTVLLVEDEEQVRELAAEILRELGYTVIAATDGPDALRRLRSDVRVDVLVTDVGLPGGLNGRQVADAAREHRPGLPVLFTTGYSGSILAGLLAPGMEVIGKPFTFDALAAKMQAMLAVER